MFTFLLFPSLFVAALLCLTAYVQAEARWWMGFASAVSVLIIAFGVGILAREPSSPDQTDPALYVTFTLVLVAILIALGALIGLGLRRFMRRGQIAKWVFFVSWLGLSAILFGMRVT